jgi:hypothetical protein
MIETWEVATTQLLIIRWPKLQHYPILDALKDGLEIGFRVLVGNANVWSQGFCQRLPDPWNILLKEIGSEPFVLQPILDVLSCVLLRSIVPAHRA